jgi:hypothetical protein
MKRNAKIKNSCPLSGRSHPNHNPTPLELGMPKEGTCACGQPVKFRKNSTGELVPELHKPLRHIS